MYIMCICLFSDLSRWVGALQNSIIIIVVVVVVVVYSFVVVCNNVYVRF